MEFPTIDKFAKEVAEKALDEITYEGKTVREWVEIIVKQQPSEDCVKREDVKSGMIKYGFLAPDMTVTEFVEDCLPSVTPTNEDIKEAYLKGYDYGVKDWFKSKTQPTEAVSREAVEEITFQEPSYTDPYNILTEVREKVRALPTVTSERPKGKWIEVDDNDSHGWGAHRCHVCSECKDYYTTSAYEMKYCPKCGAEMEGGEDENNSGC